MAMPTRNTMCNVCATDAVGNQFPSIYHRWKYSSASKAVYLTRDQDTGLCYLVFNSECDSGFSLSDDDDECIKLECHCCPECGRYLDADIGGETVVGEIHRKMEIEMLERERERELLVERREREIYEKLKKKFEGTNG